MTLILEARCMKIVHWGRGELCPPGLFGRCLPARLGPVLKDWAIKRMDLIVTKSKEDYGWKYV